MRFRKKYQLDLPLTWFHQWGRSAEVIYLPLLFGIVHALDHRSRKRLHCDTSFYYWPQVHNCQTSRASRGLDRGKPLHQQGGKQLVQRPFLAPWLCTASATGCPLNTDWSPKVEKEGKFPPCLLGHQLACDKCLNLLSLNGKYLSTKHLQHSPTVKRGRVTTISHWMENLHVGYDGHESNLVTSQQVLLYLDKNKICLKWLHLQCASLPTCILL